MKTAASRPSKKSAHEPQASTHISARVNSIAYPLAQRQPMEEPRPPQ